MNEITLVMTSSEADAVRKALSSWDGWFSQYPTGSPEGDAAEDEVRNVTRRLRALLP